MEQEFIFTEDDGDFLVWFGKWVRDTLFWKDDEGSMDSYSKP